MARYQAVKGSPRVLRGYSPSGYPDYIKFKAGVVTEITDPADVALVEAFMLNDPGKVRPVAGTFVCDVCFETFSTAFALGGHMRKHERQIEVEKEVNEAPFVDTPVDKPSDGLAAAAALLGGDSGGEPHAD